MPLTIYDLLLLPALLLGLCILAIPRWRTWRGVLIALAPAALLLTYSYSLQRQDDRVAIEAGFLGADDKALALKEGYNDAAAWSQVRVAATAEQERRGRQACIDDFNCWTNRYVDEAARVCAPAVERLALNSFEWRANGALERFPRAIIGPGGLVITYIGDAVTFQNGFGADIIQNYECTYDVERERVLAVNASSGQL